MGRYYDECEDRYVDAIPAQTDLAMTRSYLSDRVDETSSAKSYALRPVYFMDADDAPKTVKEMIERITAGKFIAPDEKVDAHQAESHYGYRPYNAIQWRTQPADSKGYWAAIEEVNKASTEAKDVIKTGTEKDGLDALRAFQSKTFH